MTASSPRSPLQRLARLLRDRRPDGIRVQEIIVGLLGVALYVIGLQVLVWTAVGIAAARWDRL